MSKKIKYIIFLLLFWFLITGYSQDIKPKAAFFNETIDSVCLGGIYNWRGNDYTEAGEYYDSLQTVNGEDSIYKLTLSVYTITDSSTIYICNGDSTLIYGEYQNQEGFYYDTIVVNNDCDTVLVTEIKYYQSTFFEQISICKGDSVFVGGAWQTESGMYSDSYQSLYGCDSVVYSIVSITDGGDSTIKRTICKGDSILFSGNYYKIKGTYIHKEPSHTNGCDSTSILILNVLELPELNVTAEPQIIEEGKSSQLSVQAYNAIIWTPNESLSCNDCPNPIATPDSTTTYVVKQEYNNCPLVDSVTVTVIERSIKVNIPDGFSPNGDNINDYFEILYLDEFPKNNIKIYNRWGNKVFEASPYQNNWNGKNKSIESKNNELPEGTYYYILTLELDKKKTDVIKGYVYLKR